MSTDDLPRYERPPVVETVLSVQFAPLQHFSNAHAGWLWKNYLGPEWENVREAPHMPDQFERFGDDHQWPIEGTQIHIGSLSGPQRFQFVRNDDERMLQVQDTRFIYNWRKRSNEYPSYATLLPEFLEEYKKFSAFVDDSGSGAIEPNQWEVTYVNQIPSGELWETVRDWPKIIPGLYLPFGGNNIETTRAEWHSAIGTDIGRLYIQLMHARVRTTNAEVMALQLTARGPIKASGGTDFKKGFDIGHETIVRSFTELTSAAAHEFWGRQK